MDKKDDGDQDMKSLSARGHPAASMSGSVI